MGIHRWSDLKKEMDLKRNISPERRAQLDAESHEALAEYRRTGEHVTDEDMTAWLESWGTEHELPSRPVRDRNGVPVPKTKSRP